MGWADVVEGAIHVVQGKTGEKLWIPMHPELSAALDAWGREGELMLMTSFGKPFSEKGFSNFMADKIGEAGLPDRCVTHGLRKAAARRLAEAGCSSKEIASITGHRTLAEIERYTRGAEQRKLAVSAMARLPLRPLQEFPNRSEGLGNMGFLARQIKGLGGGFDPRRERHDLNELVLKDLSRSRLGYQRCVSRQIPRRQAPVIERRCGGRRLDLAKIPASRKFDPWPNLPEPSCQRMPISQARSGARKLLHA
jgi:hypothetical protein